MGIPVHPKPALWVSTWLADQGGRSPQQRLLHPSGMGPPTAVHSSRGRLWPPPTQLCPGPISESTDQLGNLGSEPHPIRPPGPPIGCLSHMLKSVGIGEEALLLVPSFLLCILIQELPYVEGSWGRRADGGLGHLPRPSPGGHKSPGEVFCGCIAAICQQAKKRPPTYFLIIQPFLTGP